MFVNPPPRRHFPARPPAPPVTLAREAADVVALREGTPGLPGRITSDSQNVHDSSIVKSVKVALDKLGPSQFSMEKTVLDVRAYGEKTERAHESGRRAEPAYYPCKALREAGDYDGAYYYFLKARGAPRPLTQACLFIEKPVYDYLLDFERCVLWYLRASGAGPPPPRAGAVPRVSREAGRAEGPPPVHLVQHGVLRRPAGRPPLRPGPAPPPVWLRVCGRGGRRRPVALLEHRVPRRRHAVHARRQLFL